MAFKATNLPDQIARYLRSKIIRGELPPGKRICEAELAEELGVSRGPIREALLILEKKMLVELTPRRGARVTEMSGPLIDSLYDILTELYALLARKTAEKRTEADLLALDEALKKMEHFALIKDAAGYYESVFEYGAACQRAVQNPLLDRLLDDYEASIRRTEFASLSRRLAELGKNLEYIRRLTENIRERNAEMAAQTIRDFLGGEKRFALELSMEAQEEKAEESPSKQPPPDERRVSDGAPSSRSPSRGLGRIPD